MGVTPLASSSPQSQKQQHPEATKVPEDTRAVKPNESPLASSNSESQKQQHPEVTKELKDTRAEKPNESNKQARTDGDSDRVTLLEEENFDPSCHRMRLLKMGEMMRLHNEVFLKSCFF